MDYMDRGGKLIKNKTGQDKFLNMVYSNMGGRFVMKILAAPVVSRGIGCFMDHWPSAFLIGRFIRKNHIRMSEYECRKYRSFNDFFTRRLKEGMRPVDREPSHLIAPCDAAVMAYPIDLRTKVYMKHSVYTIGSMLRNYSLAAQYMGGYCIVLRLSVDDYHRYCYVDSGAKGRNHFIPGVLHTVNPAVLDHVKIYKENARSYCVIDTKNFGKVVQMEVGAMCVGRITNYHHKAIVRRGQEKGRFEFGGSTVVLLLRRDYVAVDDDILKNSAEGIETKVKLGERIGKALFHETIKEDIKAGTYRRAYLLFGVEGYLKKFYRDKLKEGILCGSDEMNFSVFEGKGIDPLNVVHIGQTLPFFAPRRLVLVENSGWFKHANESGAKNSFADALKSFPDTTVVIFCEEEVDKRGRLYKAVKECGYICEFTAMDIKDLKLWVAGLLKGEGKKITDGTMNYFLEKVGTDMGNIRTEVEKLSAYTLGRDVIEVGDVDAICTEQITGQIFKMMDQIAMQNVKNALVLYHDLLLLREKPMHVLFLMLRQFNLLMQVKQMGAEGMANAEIAKKAGIPPFAVNKYLSQARAFTAQVLREAVQYGVETEAQVKSGRMDEQIAVELMLIHFADLAGKNNK